MHTIKYISEDITVIDPGRGESIYDRCEFAGHGGSTWEVDKKSFEFKMNKAYSLLGKITKNVHRSVYGFLRLSG